MKQHAFSPQGFFVLLSVFSGLAFATPARAVAQQTSVTLPPLPELLQYCGMRLCSQIRFPVPLSECHFSSNIVIVPGQDISLSASGTAEGTFNRYNERCIGNGTTTSCGTTQTGPMGVVIDRGDAWYNVDRNASILGALKVRLMPLSGEAVVPAYTGFRDQGGSVTLRAPADSRVSGYRLEFFVPTCGPTTFAAGAQYTVEAIISTTPTQAAVVPAPAVPVETPVPTAPAVPAESTD